MKAVIVRAERQGEEVDRLVQYIKNLDGTDVTVIPASEKIQGYPARNNYALVTAAEAIGEEAFFWLEPDCVPLQKGWLDKIKSVYFSVDEEFMLSSDFNPPHDLIGGIGVYGPSTRWLIPKIIPEQGWGWDTWLMNHIPHTVYRTPLIQHSYGIYNNDGIAEPHRFPRDRAMIRDNALVFHRDKHQDLIHYV
jgi:hypothetical protein